MQQHETAGWSTSGCSHDKWRAGCICFAAAASFVALGSAQAQSLNISEPFLFYVNQTPSIWAGPGGQFVAFGADITLGGPPAVPASPSEIYPVVSTNAYSTSNIPTNLELYLNPDPQQVDKNLWYSQYATSFNYRGYPYKLTNTSAVFTLNVTSNVAPYALLGSRSLGTLAGPGQIPAVQNVTLSGTAANPTFTWSAPPGFSPQGYLLQIWQLCPTTNLSCSNTTLGPDETVVSTRQTQTSYTIQASDFTVPGATLINNTPYVLEIESLTTRDGSTNLSPSNVAAEGRVYVGFDTTPGGAPPVNLPTVVPSAGGAGVQYDFDMTVATGQTYYIDPAIATGYIYQIGPGNPDFASVELPNIGNPTPYELLSWNGSKFVFDAYLPAGEVYDFGSGGVSEFEVLGITAKLGLDPDDTTAFITGLTFEGGGAFTGTMTPLTTSVPEPSSWAMMLVGFAGLGFAAYRRTRSFNNVRSGVSINGSNCR